MECYQFIIASKLKPRTLAFWKKTLAWVGDCAVSMGAHKTVAKTENPVSKTDWLTLNMPEHLKQDVTFHI